MREMTVAELIAELEKLPAHHFVSPFIDGCIGAGLALWQSVDKGVPLVLFGELPVGTPPTVPAEWAAS